mmetsp:Transcript_15726/g.51365  ORF Transcript_15726/g.51365 Transcript_15726/m.51365 type:complete len:209 (-) Transcript_15726:284-910(-)
MAAMTPGSPRSVSLTCWLITTSASQVSSSLIAPVQMSRSEHTPLCRTPSEKSPHSSPSSSMAVALSKPVLPCPAAQARRSASNTGPVTCTCCSLSSAQISSTASGSSTRRSHSTSPSVFARCLLPAAFLSPAAKASGLSSASMSVSKASCTSRKCRLAGGAPTPSSSCRTFFDDRTRAALAAPVAASALALRMAEPRTESGCVCRASP